MADITVNVESMKRVDLVTVSGRVDSNTAPELDDALKASINRGCHNIVLEMSGVDYLSSAGLRALVSARRACNGKNGDVRLATPSERVQEVLELAGLDSIFETYDDVVNAVGSF